MGVRRRRHTHSLARAFVVLLAAPFLVMSAAYALFSQQLSVNATGSSVSYVSSQYMTMVYTKSATYNAGTYTYSFSPVTITNNGVTSVTAWQTTFVVPADAPTPTCASSVVCTKSGTKVTVKNGAGNGTITSGGSTTFTMSFTSATAAYTLQTVTISGTFSAAYETISGLTVGIVRGSSTKVKGIFNWKPVITVTNNTGQSLSGWQLVITPWASTYRVTSAMPSGVSYTTTASQLTFTSTNTIANGASYQFQPTITTSHNRSWNPAGDVQGRG